MGPHPREAGFTDGLTVVLLEFPALSAEALCVRARGAAGPCAALFNQSEAGWVWAVGRDLKASSARALPCLPSRAPSRLPGGED